ncbi:hypothetical protein AtNW77_Chr1g0066701 [Arabidopsis thaliana]
MDHLEDLIRGRDRMEGSNRNGARNRVDQLEGFSKNDYLDWIEYVEGSNHHCFDRSEDSEKSYIREDIDHDAISVGISEGSIEGNNDESLLLKSSKHEDSKGYKKGKSSKAKDSLKCQIVD